MDFNFVFLTILLVLIIPVHEVNRTDALDDGTEVHVTCHKRFFPGMTECLCTRARVFASLFLVAFH